MHLLISGIPASGKSTFSRWLEEKKGFLHLNVEKNGVLNKHGLAQAWNTLFDATGTTALFIDALEKFNRPVVIDWGLPPEHLNTVRKLSEGGVMLWWFAADWAVARRKFKERGTLPMELFDVQIEKIDAVLPEINRLFRSHKEYTLASTGIYMPAETIWKGMLDTLVEPSRRRLGAPIPHAIPHPDP